MARLELILTNISDDLHECVMRWNDIEMGQRDFSRFGQKINFSGIFDIAILAHNIHGGNGHLKHK